MIHSQKLFVVSQDCSSRLITLALPIIYWKNFSDLTYDIVLANDGLARADRDLKRVNSYPVMIAGFKRVSMTAIYCTYIDSYRARSHYKQPLESYFWQRILRDTVFHHSSVLGIVFRSKTIKQKMVMKYLWRDLACTNPFVLSNFIFIYLFYSAIRCKRQRYKHLTKKTIPATLGT